MTSHVVSLDLAKQLKEAGYSQQSEFYFRPTGSIYHGDGHPTLPDDVAAPLSTELLEQLPETIYDEDESSGMKYDLDIWKKEGLYHVAYWWDEDTRRLSNVKHMKFSDASLPNALAEMWLWLKKENLL